MLHSPSGSAGPLLVLVYTLVKAGTPGKSKWKLSISAQRVLSWVWAALEMKWHSRVISCFYLTCYVDIRAKWWSKLSFHSFLSWFVCSSCSFSRLLFSRAMLGSLKNSVGATEIAVPPHAGLPDYQHPPPDGTFGTIYEPISTDQNHPKSTCTLGFTMAVSSPWVGSHG